MIVYFHNASLVDGLVQLGDDNVDKTHRVCKLLRELLAAVDREPQGAPEQHDEEAGNAHAPVATSGEAGDDEGVGQRRGLHHVVVEDAASDVPSGGAGAVGAGDVSQLW